MFPATTITGPVAQGGESPVCRSEARSFAHDAIDFLAHFDPRAAYPADLDVVIIRSVLADFLELVSATSVCSAALSSMH